MIAPDGRTTFLSGVDHVKWTGQWCERTGRAAYHETNRKKYGTKAVWETNTLVRLDRWGFNLLGAGCDPDAGFKPHESVVIAPGAAYVPPKDCSWAVAEADLTDRSKEAKVK